MALPEQCNTEVIVPSFELHKAYSRKRKTR